MLSPSMVHGSWSIYGGQERMRWASAKPRPMKELLPILFEKKERMT